ncbi:MAG: GIY-YIG nuclease family protein [Dehalococcoidales bacterium]|nr:MAG: GIY-YIG nuclease family protein [Dehalococcoidales bacterium]
MVDLDDMDLPAKGGYVLLLRLEKKRKIRIGKMGAIRFDSGYYAYVGSAMGGLKQRISRHLRKEKKLHWHIDYLLKITTIENIMVSQSVESRECDIAGEIAKTYKVVNGFGSSDCKCPGHLFYNPMRFNNEIMRKLASVGMKPRLILDEKDESNQ